jgi:hypothetical protein
MLWQLKNQHRQSSLIPAAAFSPSSVVPFHNRLLLRPHSSALGGTTRATSQEKHSKPRIPLDTLCRETLTSHLGVQHLFAKATA